MAAAGGLGPWPGRAPGAEPGRAGPRRRGCGHPGKGPLRGLRGTLAYGPRRSGQGDGAIQAGGSETQAAAEPGDAGGCRQVGPAGIWTDRSRRIPGAGELGAGELREAGRGGRAQVVVVRGHSYLAVCRGPDSDPGLRVRAPSGVGAGFLQRRSRTHFCCPQRRRCRSGREGRDRPPACQRLGPAPSLGPPTHRPPGARLRSPQELSAGVQSAAPPSGTPSGSPKPGVGGAKKKMN